MQANSFESFPAAPDAVVTHHEATPIDTLAYCCLVSPGVLALGLEEFMESLNPADRQVQISGLLMWEGRLMIHWLEAPRHQLDALWQHIQNDSRQHCLVLLKHERGIKSRWFERWQMQPASRNEMMAIVREARETAHRTTDGDGQALQHAMSTLSILLNPELATLYAQADVQADIRANTKANTRLQSMPFFQEVSTETNMQGARA